MSTALAAGLVVIVALLGVLVAGLLRSHAEILRALHDLGVNLDPDRTTGAPGPGRAAAALLAPPDRDAPLGGRELDVVGTTPAGEARHVAVAGAAHRTVVAFLSSSCRTCRTFWRSFAEPDLAVPGGARLVVVTQGPESESPSAVEELAPRGVLTLLSTETWEAYDVPGAPYFVLVDGPTGRVIGEGTGVTWAQVAELLGRATADAARPGSREAEVDAVLRAAGIEPGHESLYPDAPARPGGEP